VADNQDSLFEIVQGMAEIKLQGSYLKRRWRWMQIQAKLFKVQLTSLSISQYQDIGAQFINQLKDILITYIAAKAVIDGELTLGMMLSIQYITGQLNGPLQQMVGFIRAAQDASLSLERIAEVHQMPNESIGQEYKSAEVPDGDIHIENLSFRYTPILDDVLSDITLSIEKGKTTAIVGSSGSGKTTLVKLLLGFYTTYTGKIVLGNIPMKQISEKAWRSHCGVVMQDGYIFSDTIASNISESDEDTNIQKVNNAIITANLQEYIESLPLGINTKIGLKGNGLSQGQRQRLLIARAAYKNPDFLFFDEATNALDANNEKKIMENLSQFLENKTAIVVAHRLSTVRHADKIIVLEKGRIVEQGKHDDLVKQKGFYFTLVQNQLELGQ
jgi:ATP-binding cassette, subfamily B, bacterial